jgi:tetratricopeptide (TPR) repeat protein
LRSASPACFWPDRRWVIGSQQATLAPGGAAAPAQASAPAQTGTAAPPTRAAVLDDTQVKALKSVAEREPSNAQARTQLGNLYFDAERYEDAISWYSESLKRDPKDVNVSTDLGVCYYYTNQPDKAWPNSSSRSSSIPSTRRRC